jgi:hypothetical protein
VDLTPPPVYGQLLGFVGPVPPPGTPGIGPLQICVIGFVAAAVCGDDAADDPPARRTMTMERSVSTSSGSGQHAPTACATLTVRTAPIPAPMRYDHGPNSGNATSAIAPTMIPFAAVMNAHWPGESEPD